MEMAQLCYKQLSSIYIFIGNDIPYIYVFRKKKMVTEHMSIKCSCKFIISVALHEVGLYVNTPMVASIPDLHEHTLCVFKFAAKHITETNTPRANGMEGSAYKATGPIPITGQINFGLHAADKNRRLIPSV